jgi:hypothetical protein
MDRPDDVVAAVHVLPHREVDHRDHVDAASSEGQAKFSGSGAHVLNVESRTSAKDGTLCDAG